MGHVFCGVRRCRWVFNGWVRAEPSHSVQLLCYLMVYRCGSMVLMLWRWILLLLCWLLLLLLQKWICLGDIDCCCCCWLLCWFLTLLFGVVCEQRIVGGWSCFWWQLVMLVEGVFMYVGWGFWYNFYFPLYVATLPLLV